jgi:hypothetical protein
MATRGGCDFDDLLGEFLDAASLEQAACDARLTKGALIAVRDVACVSD